MCLLGVIKLKFIVKPNLSPKTVKFWPKTGLFHQKCLTMGALKSKLPLIEPVRERDGQSHFWPMLSYCDI